MPATKVDQPGEVRELYRARPEPVIVDVPEMAFLMIDGCGDPNVDPGFQEAIQALYAVAYTAKFTNRRAGGEDFRVMPLEALWWTSESSPFADAASRDWSWTLMLMQPDHVSAELVEHARETASDRRPLDAIARVRLERFEEGRAAQVLHVGPYAAEAPTIERLHAFIGQSGLHPRGRHHEIYLGDPRRAAPERLKTIIRQPVDDD